MDSSPSKHLSEAEQERRLARRATIRRGIIIVVSTVILVAVVVAAVLGTHVSSKREVNHGTLSMPAAIEAVCSVTLHKDTCYKSLVSFNPKTGQPDELFGLSMVASLQELNKTSETLGGLSSENLNSTMVKLALGNCYELLGLAVNHVKDTLTYPSDLSKASTLDSLKTWLSAAGTDQETCLDGFVTAPEAVRIKISEMLQLSSELTSNSLAIANWKSVLRGTMNYRRRRLLSHGEPGWISVGARRLMTSSTLTSMANITVAKDGTGMYRNISDALGAVPDKCNSTTIIYVTKGVYYENVRVEKSKWNVVIIGDGSNETIVSGSLNVVDGFPTFSSATYAVFGKGFMARDMGFYNTAGDIKQQAVALMSTADMSVFVGCRFDGFQATLYPHSNRQFYKDCDIYGTVDFIFGNAAVVLQSCNIYLRKRILGQQNTITGQGKSDPNMNTGISIHKCTILPFGDLTNVRSYLGRPAKDYSTTIFMSSNLSNSIDSAGWLPWGTTAPDTILYAEYMNIGPGAGTEDRVNWTGLKLNLTKKEAAAFTVRAFLQGDKWLPSGLSYTAGL